MKSKSSKAQAIGQLSLIVFFNLLQVGEYTAPCYVTTRAGVCKAATQTKQFCVGDVGFWKDGKILPRNSPLEKLLEADNNKKIFILI